MTLGNRIKIARKRLRMSQAVLARHTKVDQSSIAYWESGRTSPKYSRLLELASILEVTPEWLQFGINSGGTNATVPLVATIGLPGSSPACADTSRKPIAEQFVELGMGQSCEDCVAVAIRGNALTPAYMDGDVLIGERQKPESMMAGTSTDCVIGMKDGRTLLARAPAGRHGPHNPITNPANVAWVMQIAWIRRSPLKSLPVSDTVTHFTVSSEEPVTSSPQPVQVAAH
ncbi:MAG: helix-turn-helix transcriptional regulator [Alphaproteobacteria bacterium]|jgi:transcriptional regulator with XRE-family HTH domain|nr:helix-turn-helix transcriptional regulator [Alphaproteobacteria bacterium]MBT4086412.1 helix-turn-helix transcriptional regulator [Alphaproteobacteria bacterium]MBT4546392.1 helix-turn-helix transcriptional regulator [Alphaproteobacteria bacterium]MBT7748043.1 helix-turn-helix transcriptional regulator [Alphaproteobacteria bacterium]